MGGPIRIDWQQIKARWGAEVGVSHLAILPKGFTALVLAIQERLHWEATYRIEQYDYADWDLLQSIVDEGLAGLTDTMRLSDLIAILDEVEPLLEAILDKPCCEDSGAVLDIITDDDGLLIPGDETGSDIVRGVGDPPGESETWEQYDAALCQAAQKFVAELPGWARRVESAQSALSGGLFALTAAAAALVLAQMAAFGVIAAGLAAVLGGGLGVLTWMHGLRDLLVGPPLDYVSAEQELVDDELVDALVCAIIQAQTPLEAENAIDAVLIDKADQAAPLIRLLPLRYLMHKVFNAELEGSGFGACPECEDPFDFNFTFTFDENLQGWGGSGCRVTYNETEHCASFGMGNAICGWGRVNTSGANVAAKAELVPETNYTVRVMSWSMRRTTGTGVDNNVRAKLHGETLQTIPTSEIPTEWTTYEVVYLGDDTFNNTSGELIEFEGTGSSNPPIDVLIDNVHIRGNVVEA